MLAINLEKAVILGQKKLPKTAMLMIRLRLDFKELEKIVNLPLVKVELFWITNEGRSSVTSKCLEIQTTEGPCLNNATFSSGKNSH